jgi:ABC-2 type transport system permease protein
LANSITTIELTPALRQSLKAFGGPSILTPSGYLSFTFLIFIFAASLFICGQIASLRREEAEQRLEHLLALPVGRLRWLLGRITVAFGGCVIFALVASLAAWAGAQSAGLDVQLDGMIGAAGNFLPTVILFLGLGIALFGFIPRWSVVVIYGLVGLSFIWDLIGSLLNLPSWVLGISPFNHIGYVPAQGFRTVDAIVVIAIGIIAGIIGMRRFRQRDLATA